MRLIKISGDGITLLGLSNKMPLIVINNGQINFGMYIPEKYNGQQSYIRQPLNYNSLQRVVAHYVSTECSSFLTKKTSGTPALSKRNRS